MQKKPRATGKTQSNRTQKKSPSSRQETGRNVRQSGAEPRKKARQAAKKLGSGMAGRAAKKIMRRQDIMEKRMRDIYK